jgi:hypothetical protein
MAALTRRPLVEVSLDAPGPGGETLAAGLMGEQEPEDPAAAARDILASAGPAAAATLARHYGLGGLAPRRAGKASLAMALRAAMRAAGVPCR